MKIPRTFAIAMLLWILGLSAQGQESRIELQNHYSTILATQKYFNIFLPAGYDQETSRFPVVYLFRGHEREWANPTEDASRQGNIKTVADRLYARGSIGKMILVMPGLSAPGTPAEFSYVVDELIPYVDSRFRTIGIRQERGMDGFSYGGYDMLELLWRSPERFITAGAYDGSYWAFDLNLLVNAQESYWTELRPMKFLIQSAVQGGTNYDVNQQFLGILAAHGIQNEFDSLALSPQSSHNWFFADMHAEQSLPLHWKQFLTGIGNLPIELIAPLPGGIISGLTPIVWSPGPTTDTLRTVVEYSRDRGASWVGLYDSKDVDTTFLWNTALVPDGTRYLLRIRAYNNALYGFVQSAQRFTVNNPGNAPPEVEILAPDTNQQLSGIQTVQWWADDADDDAVSISLDASTDRGLSWTHLSNAPNSGAYSWDTRDSPNSSSYRLRVRGSDTVTFGEAISHSFCVNNNRPSLRDTLIHHITGAADGRITVHIVNPPAVTGHRYRVTLHDSTPGTKTYSVLDLDRATAVLTGTPVGSADQEGPLFDGVRLVLADIDPPRVSTDSSRWITGTSDLVPDITLPTVDPGTGPINGIPYVSDYQIRTFDHVVDTSSALFGWTPALMNFSVWNVTEGHQVKVLFTDLNADQLISRYDDVIILEKDSLGQPLLTWELSFSGVGNPKLPSPGDIFLLKVLKPFTSKDIYEFIAVPSGIVSAPPAGTPFTFRLDQNYPNPFNPTTTIDYTIAGSRVQGLGVSEVRLVVYDVLGREVAVLVNEKKPVGRYEVRFDGTRLSSGVYFYRLTADNNVQTRKMVLLK
jgi:hypothetical protein